MRNTDSKFIFALHTKNAYFFTLDNFVFHSTFVTFNKLLRLGIKNKQVYFILPSTFRNCG